MEMMLKEVREQADLVPRLQTEVEGMARSLECAEKERASAIEAVEEYEVKVQRLSQLADEWERARQLKHEENERLRNQSASLEKVRSTSCAC